MHAVRDAEARGRCALYAQLCDATTTLQRRMAKQQAQLQAQAGVDAVKARFAAKEAEWKAMVAQWQTAGAAEQQRREGELVASHATREKDQAARIEGLETLLKETQEKSEQQRQQLAQVDRVIEDKLRDQAREWRAKEAEAKENTSRALGLREQLRYDLGSIKEAYGVATTELAAAKKIGARCDNSWQLFSARELVSSEERARGALDEFAGSSFAMLQATLREATSLHASTTGVGNARAADTLKHVGGAVRRARRGLGNVPVAASVGDDDDADANDTESAVAESLTALCDEAQSAVSQRDAELAAARDAISGMEAVIAQQAQRQQELESHVAERLASLAHRERGLQSSLAQVRNHVAETATARASGHAASSVLEELVAEHDATVAGLRAQLAASEEKHRALVRAHECEDIDALVAERRALANEVKAKEAESQRHQHKTLAVQNQNDHLNGELSALAARHRLLQNDLTAAARVRNEEVAALQQELGRAHASYEELDSRTRDAQDAMAALQRDVNDAREEAADMRRLAADLRERVVTSEAAAAEADRHRKRVIEAELERHRQAKQQQQQVGGGDAAGADEDGGPSSSSAGPGAVSEAALAHLEQRYLLMARERNGLRKQLDSAIAEVSAAEERRNHTQERLLNMLHAEDAAPRREQALQQRTFEIEQLESKLGRREAELLERETGLKKKEISLLSKAARSRIGSPMLDGVRSPSHYGSLEGERGHRGSSRQGPPRSLLSHETHSTSSTANDNADPSHYSHVPDKAAIADRAPPVTYRPHDIAPADVSHPQRPPPPASW